MYMNQTLKQKYRYYDQIQKFRLIDESQIKNVSFPKNRSCI